MFVWIRWSARRIRPGAERTRVLESRMTARLHESFARHTAGEELCPGAIRGTAVFRGRERSDARACRPQHPGGDLLLGRRHDDGRRHIRGRVRRRIAGPPWRGQHRDGPGGAGVSRDSSTGRSPGLANTIGSIQQALAGVRRVRDTLGQAREAIDDGGGIEPGRLEGRVEFEHVSFGYDTPRVLDDITFVAEPGEFVALVGPSGSGKTTLVSLIPRFYEPTDGRILIDGAGRSRIASVRCAGRSRWCCRKRSCCRGPSATTSGTAASAQR